MGQTRVPAVSKHVQVFSKTLQYLQGGILWVRDNELAIIVNISHTFL